MDFQQAVTLAFAVPRQCLRAEKQPLQRVDNEKRSIVAGQDILDPGRGGHNGPVVGGAGVASVPEAGPVQIFERA